MVEFCLHILELKGKDYTILTVLQFGYINGIIIVKYTS